MERPPLLALSGARLSRGGRTVVRDLDLELAPRARLLVRGANGSGKSTLAQAVCGLLPLEAGTLHAPHPVGYAPQEPRFPEALHGRAYLTQLAALGGAGERAPREAEAALERFHLRADADRRIGALSRGWRQRLNLARAWLGAPALIVLDEPQTALDPEGMQALHDALDEDAPAALIVAPPGVGCEALAPEVLDLERHACA